MIRTAATTCSAALAAFAAPLAAQSAILGRATNVVVPQYRSFAAPDRMPVRIERVSAQVNILEQTAKTTLLIELFNPSQRQEEAVLLLPVPGECAVGEFAFDGSASEPTARLLPAEEARRTYDEIVRKLRDPGLLEFAGARLVRSSVFPIPAGGRAKVKIAYDHVLEADGDRIDYLLMRSEALGQSVPWDIQVDIRAKSPVAMVYSPSHEVQTDKLEAKHLVVKLEAAYANTPGPFQLSYLIERGGAPSASLFAYPDPKVGGGYFLLIASAPRTMRIEKTRREVTIVLDRSGSMAGEKMDQALAATRQVIEALDDGELFNLIDYSTTVEKFAPAPVAKSAETIKLAREYLARVRPLGGTNIHDALVEALRQPASEGALPLVLFLTDGLPTVGKTSEKAIRDMVAAGNPHSRRVFTFGVGADVNVPLLDRIAEQTRAASTYVLPKQDVELEVGRVFRKLRGPVLATPELVALDPSGAVTTRRVRERYPQALPDLYAGDQLVVLGQFRDEDPLKLVLRGTDGEDTRTFQFEFALDKATTKNAFVPRLWASRRVADLVDQVRQAGADTGSPRPAGFDPFADPKLRELRDEIMRLSTEFGILTEYTSFLATEGTDLGNWSVLTKSCGVELDSKAWNIRSGYAAINQGLNNDLYGKNQVCVNPRNFYLDSNLTRVETTTVQQICDRAFFKRGTQWIDGRLVRRGNFEPTRAITFGSPEHLALVERLTREGRQGTISLTGEIVLELDGEILAIRN